jgi:hypothetical protein
LGDNRERARMLQVAKATQVALEGSDEVVSVPGDEGHRPIMHWVQHNQKVDLWLGWKKGCKSFPQYF